MTYQTDVAEAAKPTTRNIVQAALIHGMDDSLNPLGGGMEALARAILEATKIETELIAALTLRCVTEDGISENSTNAELDSAIGNSINFLKGIVGVA